MIRHVSWILGVAGRLGETISSLPVSPCDCQTYRKRGMVRLSGVEPPTSGATNLRSNQLSYNRTRRLEGRCGSNTAIGTDLQVLSSQRHVSPVTNDHHALSPPAERPDRERALWACPALTNEGGQCGWKDAMTFSAACFPGLATSSATLRAASCMERACSSVTSACLRMKEV
jgi:hypothetical protein